MPHDAQLWIQFAGSMAALLAAHAVPARPPLRRRLVGALGEGVYVALHSAMSLLLLAWMFRATAEAPYVELWPAMDWQRFIPRLLVPAAFAFGVVGLCTPNRLSLSANRRPDDASGSILGITRHPVLWALALWAAAHIVPNGDLAHVMLFGTLLALCLAGMALMDRGARRRLGQDEWKSLAARRPLVPFSRPASLSWPSRRDLLLGFVGLALAGAALALHEIIIGVPAA
nr:NnrU family protein [uncultured Devosia sp.]